MRRAPIRNGAFVATAILSLLLVATAQPPPLGRGVSSRTALLPVVAPAAPAPQAPPTPLWKEASTTAAGYPWFPDYVRVLERFPLYFQRGWHEVESGGARIGYFGGPDHDERAMPALVDAVVTLAALVPETTYDPRVSGVAVERLREQAVQAIRHALATHVSGEGKRPDGQSWGGTAASGDWAVRLAVAAQAMDRYLSEADRTALRRVLAHEAAIAAAREPRSQVLGKSAAPANARDAATLAWAASVAPADERTAGWEAAARVRMMNTLTTVQDRADPRRVDGKPVRDWVRSENLLPEYLPEQDGAASPDAAFAALESLALARAAYLAAGRPPPEATLHGVPETWQTLHRLWLPGGRFAYPSGQIGPRYLTGPPTALTSAAGVQSAGIEIDLARAVERALFRSLEWEQSQNQDGTFFATRFSGGAVTGEGARFETAAYAAVAIALRVHRITARLTNAPPLESVQRSLDGSWLSRAGELGAARSPRAFASFSWRAGGAAGLTGVFAPPGGDDMICWPPDQLSGSFDLEGLEAARVVEHRDRLAAGGFATTGRILEGVRGGRPGLRHHVSWTALPDAGLGVLLDLTQAAQDVRVTRDEGLQLAVANDLFNVNGRRIASDDGTLNVVGVQPDGKEETRTLGSRWVNIDGRLGAVLAYGQQPFTLRDFSSRAQHPSDAFHSLLYELIDCPYRTEPVDYHPGQVVRDTAVILVAGDVAATKQVAARSRVAATGRELLRALRVVGPRGHQYLIIVNFSDREQTARLRPPGEALAPLLELRLGPLETQILSE